MMFRRLWHDLWGTLFVLLILVGLFSSKGLIIGMGAMGLLVAALSWVWNRLSLEDLEYLRKLDRTRVFAGEKVNLEVEISNNKPIPVPRLEIEDEIPDSIGIKGGNITYSPNPNSTRIKQATSVGWYETTRWDYELIASRRGYFRLGPATIKGGDLFGLFSNYKKDNSREHILVYPEVFDLPNLGLPQTNPLGDTTKGSKIVQDFYTPSGIRDYQSGDPMKIVDWNATAKNNSIKVKTYDPTSSHTFIIAVAVESADPVWSGYSPIYLERTISTAASIASYCADKGLKYGLFSNGTPVASDRPMTISPSNNPDQLKIILEILATIAPIPSKPIPVLLNEALRNFPVNSTLVVATSTMSEEFIEVIRRAKSFGHNVVVVNVSDTKCPKLPATVITYNIGEYLKKMEISGDIDSR